MVNEKERDGQTWLAFASAAMVGLLRELEIAEDADLDDPDMAHEVQEEIEVYACAAGWAADAMLEEYKSRFAQKRRRTKRDDDDDDDDS